MCYLYLEKGNFYKSKTVKLWHWQRKGLSSGKNSFLCQFYKLMFRYSSQTSPHIGLNQRKFTSYQRMLRDTLGWFSGPLIPLVTHFFPFLKFAITVLVSSWKLSSSQSQGDSQQQLEQHVFCPCMAWETKTGFSFPEVPSKPLLVHQPWASLW